MRNKIVRRISLLSLILLVGCGGGKDEEEFKFYALKEAASQQLELTVEASGTVEAISSIEIKSKASGQILFLGAEIGDYVEEGSCSCKNRSKNPNKYLGPSKCRLRGC